jgi:hypothetical protein
VGTVCAEPGSDQGQPPWIAYSLRDVRTARAGQIPSSPYLGAPGSGLKVRGEIFEAIGNRFEPLRCDLGDRGSFQGRSGVRASAGT